MLASRFVTPAAEPVAPWPDFLGQSIRHGDRLVHPADGSEFVAVYLPQYATPGDQWRAIYTGEAIPSRLCLQIGEKGRAAVATRAQPQADAAEPAAPSEQQYRVSAGPQTGWSSWFAGDGKQFEASYQVERRATRPRVDPADKPLDLTAMGRKRINAAADALSEVMAFVKLGDDLTPKVSSALSNLRAMQALAPQADAARVVMLPVWWDNFILNVCEIPDRTSPEDEPDAMIATAEELEACALNAMERFVDVVAPQAGAAESVARDAQDGPRYRWLRDLSEPGICAFYLSVGKAFDGVKFTQSTVDEAIDAQIAAQAPGARGEPSGTLGKEAS